MFYVSPFRKITQFRSRVKIQIRERTTTTAMTGFKGDKLD